MHDRSGEASSFLNEARLRMRSIAHSWTDSNGKGDEAAASNLVGILHRFIIFFSKTIIHFSAAFQKILSRSKRNESYRSDTPITKVH